MSAIAFVPEVATHPAWRDRLELLLASTGEGIYGVDLSGGCVFINRAAAKMLGYLPEQVLGRNMHDLMHHTRADGSHYPAEQCPIYQAFRHGQPCRLDCDVLWRADGVSFHAEYSSCPIFDHERITGAVVTFVDISERKRAEALLRKAHAKLEQRIAERTRELSDALREVARANARLRRLAAPPQNVHEIHAKPGDVKKRVKIRLLICDDQPLARAGFQQILAEIPDLMVSDEAADGPDAIRKIRRGGIDVVLLDIALHGRDGLDLLQRMQREFPKLPVLIVSIYPEQQYALRSLRLGARGYLNKSADPSELIAAIRKVAQGGMSVSPAVAETLASTLHKNPAQQLPHELLSPREYQVFTLIAAGKSLTEIAAQLALSLNTVSTYRARIMQKIDTHNNVETALYAVRHHLVNISTQ